MASSEETIVEGALQMRSGGPPGAYSPLHRAFEERKLDRDLQRTISDLVRPYKTTLNVPPFSMLELVTMAALSLNCYRVSRTDIINWIANAFPVFSDVKNLHDIQDPFWFDPWLAPLALTNEWSYQPYREDPMETEHDSHENTIQALKDLRSAFQNYGSPLREDNFMVGQDSRDDGESNAENDSNGDKNAATVPRYFVPRQAGKIFLGRLLTDGVNQTDKPFNFKALPPEIRNTIYRMLLRLGKGEVEVHVDFDQGGHPYGAAVGYGALGAEPVSLRSLVRSGGRLGRIAIEGETFEWFNVPVNRILSIIYVDMQIYSEARAIFYVDNRFRIPGAFTAEHFFRRLSLPARQVLTSVSIHMYFPDPIEVVYDTDDHGDRLVPIYDIPAWHKFWAEMCLCEGLKTVWLWIDDEAIQQDGMDIGWGAGWKQRDTGTDLQCPPPNKAKLFEDMALVAKRCEQFKVTGSYRPVNPSIDLINRYLDHRKQLE
ncbi:hypothetical protein KC354_g6065 [Hortaea werneckii]|nr:hypothetical protein KC354_g6065 [Hortaea werneckii]